MVTKEDFRLLVKGMKAVYTHPTFLPDTNAIQIWYDLLKDMDYKTLSCAIQTHMMTSSKQPTIADIRAAAVQFTSENELNAMEAWSIVRKAMGHALYPDDAKEEFLKLPEIIQIAVGNPANLQEWAKMDIKTVESVEQSHFIRSYNAALIRGQQIQQMSHKMTKEIVSKEPAYKITDKCNSPVQQPQKATDYQQPSAEEIDEMMKNLRRRINDR